MATAQHPRESGWGTEARGEDRSVEEAGGVKAEGGTAVVNMSTIPSGPTNDAGEAIGENKSDEENRGCGSVRAPSESTKPPLKPATTQQQQDQRQQRRGRSRFRRLPPLMGHHHRQGDRSRDGLSPTIGQAQRKEQNKHDSREDDDDDKSAGRVLRAVATANDAVCGGGAVKGRAGPITASDDSSRHHHPKPPIRLVQSLTSLSRYRSSLTFCPSEETIKCVVRSVDDALPPSDYDLSRDRAVMTTSSSSGSKEDRHLVETGSSNLGSFSSSASSGITNGASDSTLSSHFVVTTTLLDDTLQEDGVEVVAAYGMLAEQHPARAVVFAATTPRGGTVEVVGPDIGDDDVDNQPSEPVDSVAPSTSRQQESTAVEALVLCGAGPVGAEDAAQRLGTWAMKACAMAADQPAPTAAREAAASESVSGPPPQQEQHLLSPESARSGSVWSYPWLLFRSRETFAVDPDVERDDDDGDADGARAEERFVAIVKDVATLVPIHEGEDDATHTDPAQGGMGPLSPFSSQPFTAGQSRVLASLYSRATGKAPLAKQTNRKVPWEDPSRLVRTSSNSSAVNAMVNCQSAALWVLPSILGSKSEDRSLAGPERKTSKASDATSSPSGKERAEYGHPAGLFRMPRSVRSKSSAEKHFKHTKQKHASLTEMQELHSLDFGSDVSLPRNLLQFDFVLSSDLSSSYYGSSIATEISKGTTNESGTTEGDSAMKRGSYETFDPSSSSSGSMSTRQTTIVPAKPGNTKCVNRYQHAEHPNVQTSDVPDANKEEGLMKEEIELATGGPDESAYKGIKPNDSSSMEVVRYRVALGPIKFSYYARGRKKS